MLAMVGLRTWPTNKVKVQGKHFVDDNFDQGR